MEEIKKDKEELDLIRSLKEYIYWHGLRDRKTDRILPIEQQKGSVATAMTLLKELE